MVQPYVFLSTSQSSVCDEANRAPSLCQHLPSNLGWVDQRVQVDLTSNCSTLLLDGTDLVMSPGRHALPQLPYCVDQNWQRSLSEVECARLTNRNIKILQSYDAVAQWLWARFVTLAYQIHRFNPETFPVVIWFGSKSLYVVFFFLTHCVHTFLAHCVDTFSNTFCRHVQSAMTNHWTCQFKENTNRQRNLELHATFCQRYLHV